MAKLIETTVIPEPVKPPRTFTLELDENELVFLQLIMERIGGSETDSPRLYGQNIYNALRRIVNMPSSGTGHLLEDSPYKSPAIYFKSSGLAEFNKLKKETLSGK